MSIQKVFLSEFEIYPLSRVEVEQVLSAGSYPFCGTCHSVRQKLPNEKLEDIPIALKARAMAE